LDVKLNEGDKQKKVDDKGKVAKYLRK